MPILRLWIRRLNPHSKTLKRFRFIDFLQNLSWNILIKCFASRDNEFGISRMIIRLAKLQSHEVSIIQNISKAPVEKSCFELAKHFLREGKCNEAKILFKSMTSKPDCDWRVFYRSCYFLTVIAQIENDSGSLAHYKMLLKIANPHFPITTEEGVKWVSRET